MKTVTKWNIKIILRDHFIVIGKNVKLKRVAVEGCVTVILYTYLYASEIHTHKKSIITVISNEYYIL